MQTSGPVHTDPSRDDHVWVVRVLGPLEVRVGSASVTLGGPQQRLVLALLIADAGRPVTTERLIADVWPEDPPERARKTIQVYASNLRRQLGGTDGLLQPASYGYRFAAELADVDVVGFERALAVTDVPAAGDPAETAARNRHALGLWMGAPYDDVPDAAPIRAERVRLAELRLVALERCIDADLALGRHRQLIGELEALTIEHPYRERFVAQLALAQYRAGRQADALRSLRRARRTLDVELGIEPNAELRALEHHILNQDLDLDLQGTATTTAAPGEGHVAAARSHDRDQRSIRGFELRQPLTTDGDVSTYLAYQASAEREVVVTIIRPPSSNAADFVRRFEVDAQRVAQLEHPNIVTLDDYWRDPDGAYLVTRWLRGGLLADACAAEALPTSAALRVVGEVGEALGHAHRQGVVHGAVSTSAVLLDEDGHAYLGGFQVAGHAASAMAVPAADGAAPAATDGRSPADDVVALAVVARELLADALMVGAGAAGDGGLATELETVLAPVLARDAGHGPGRAEDLVRALRRAAGVDSVGVVDVQPRPFADVRNPYKGLRAFARADAEDFHGREELAAQLVETVANRRLVAVVGPSGSGKSSVVRAGLLPQLTDQLLLATEMFPGAFPFEELETALLRVAIDRPTGMVSELTADDRGLLRVVKQIVPDERHEVLLVIDQFEELFSLVRDAETQQAFMDALLTALTDPRSQLRVVLTLRADFFDRPLQHAGFGDLLKQGLTPVTVPARDELARAVSLPAAAVGLDLEPGLTGEIVTDVQGQPGGLPLLQYALTELFRTRRSNRLTTSDYRRIGGVTGALGTRAEELYLDLGEAAREAARQVFLRLVAAGDGDDDVRRRVRLSELSTLALDRASLDSALERYGSHRLLSFDRDPITRGPTVEVAHEALLREWNRLRGWVDARRADLILHERFAAAVDEWERAGRDGSYLAHGGRLAQFEDGVAESELTLTAPERDFLDASRERRAAEQRAVEERARQQERTNRRLRRLLTGVGVLSLLAAIAGIVAFAQARRAGAEAVEADARRVGAQALSAGDVDRALLLAVEGMRLDDSPDTRANLLTTLGRSPELTGVVRGDGDYAFGTVSLSEDGTVGAVYDDANRLHVFDLETQAITATYETGESSGTPGYLTGRAVFHPDGGPVAVGFSTIETQPVRLLDPETFEELPEALGGYPSLGLLPWGMAYSTDGALLAVAFDVFPDPGWLTIDGSVVVVWDVSAPDEPVAILEDVPRFTHEVAFGPEGRLLYTATHAAPPQFDARPAITVYDLDTRKVVRTLDAPSHPFALSPDGTRMAVAAVAPELADSETGTDVLVLDPGTGGELQRLRGHTGAVNDIAFSTDGSMVVTGGGDRTVAVWDLATGDRTQLLEGHAGAVASVAFGPDGSTVVSAGVDAAVLLWDRAGDRRFVTVREAEGDLLERSGIGVTEDNSFVSPTGAQIVSITSAEDEDGGAYAYATSMQLVDAASGRAGPVTETGHGGFIAVAWHPDGGRLATAGEDGVVRVWDPETMTVLAERKVTGGRIPGLAYLDGGDELLFVGMSSVPTQRIDAETLEPRAAPFPTPVTGWLAFPFTTPDSDVVAVVAGVAGVDVSGNEDQREERLLLMDWRSGTVDHAIELGFDGEHAALSPDGARVAVVGYGGQLAMYDVELGELVRPPITAHDGPLTSVSYAPDGDLAASAARDGRVALWEGDTGELLGTVEVASAGTPAYVGFQADGDAITVATQDGRIHTIDVRPERWVEQACAIAGRNLTRDEWRDAFGERPYRATCAGR